MNQLDTSARACRMPDSHGHTVGCAACQDPLLERAAGDGMRIQMEGDTIQVMKHFAGEPSQAISSWSYT